jgi:hypothetical protein
MKALSLHLHSLQQLIGRHRRKARRRRTNGSAPPHKKGHHHAEKDQSQYLNTLFNAV